MENPGLYIQKIALHTNDVGSLYCHYMYVSLPPSSENMQLLWPEVPFLFEFMEHIAQDEERSDGVVACCAGLLG